MEQFDRDRSRTSHLVSEMVRLFTPGADAWQSEEYEAVRREYLRQQVIDKFIHRGFIPPNHDIG